MALPDDEDGGRRRHGPPQPNVWWDQGAEARLNYMHQRMGELAQQLNDLSRELNKAVRSVDANSADMRRLDERLREIAREMQDVPKRLERVASAEWNQRLETRLSLIEDEQRSPFVRKTEFDPLRRGAYWLLATAGALVMAFIGNVLFNK